MDDLTIVGCALPFRQRALMSTMVLTAYDGAQSAVPAHAVEFAHGSCSVAIHHGRIRLEVNNVAPEDFPSQQDGSLNVFENAFGVYLRGTLPDTELGRDVYDAIVSGKIQHLCCRSADSESQRDGETDVVFQADLFRISLLFSARHHFASSWIWPAGPLAEERIRLEDEQARQIFWWALDGAITPEDTYQRPAPDSPAHRRLMAFAACRQPRLDAINRRLERVKWEQAKAQCITTDTLSA